MTNSGLILASTSVYRRELLARLHIPFAAFAANADESLRDEPPAQRATRLAAAKATSASAAHPNAFVIGSDQVCSVRQKVLRKAGSAAGQHAQLSALSGQTVCFDTAVSLAHAGDILGTTLVPTQVQFRNLDAQEITDYVAREPAADCAGGFKVESLGITLFEWVRSDDPTALVGLPLIATSTLLRRFAPQLLSAAA